MLELVLNAAWLTVGLFAAVAVFSAREDRSRRLVRVVAVACMLLLLFPVISLSDDLHAPAATLTDASSAGDTGRLNVSPDHDATVTLALASAADALRLQFLHFVENGGSVANPSESHARTSDALRAPPLA
jgi:hypothetical protein